MISEKIRDLIELKTEGPYWDFKQEWHSNNVDLLHDIICMANNLEDCDAYIIIGVTDSGIVCGVPETNRKNQQKLIDFLSRKKFAGIRPIVYVQCIDIDDKQIDVIIIKNTLNTPYYLDEDFKDKNKTIYKGNIYTRVADTNTPKDCTADIDKVEILWRKRFGLVGTSERRINRILLSDGWICEDANEYFFNEYHPEIRIDINESETASQKERCTAHDNFFYLYSNLTFWNGAGSEELIRKCYDVLWYGNRIRQFCTVSATKMDFDFVEPNGEPLNTDIGIILDYCHSGVYYSYFIEDSFEYAMFKRMLTLQCANKGKYGIQGVFCSRVIPIFKHEDEHIEFMNYVVENKEKFKSEYCEMEMNHMFCGGEAKTDSRIEQSLKLGCLLVSWLEKWRNSFI